MRALWSAVLVLGLVVVPNSWAQEAPETLQVKPVRMSMLAMGVEIQIEVRDLTRTDGAAAIRRALAEIHQIAQLTDPDQVVPGGIAFLNAAAGAGHQPMDAALADLLISASRYCLWSSNAHGPLGGELYRLWDAPSGAMPHPNDLRTATDQAECGRLRLSGSTDQPTAELAEHTKMDLRGFRRGYAVDRAAAVLEEAGARNYWIEAGTVYRASGPGNDGTGWLVTIPAQPDNDDVTERMKLRNQSVAVVSVYGVGDEVPARWIDQRTGVPTRGVLTQITVAANAFDAEMVATSLFILGLREGQRRLGSLQPRPSILWLLGDNSGGEPLVSTYRWSEVEHLKRKSY